jgi:hypothetical protein
MITRLVVVVPHSRGSRTASHTRRSWGAGTCWSTSRGSGSLARAPPYATTRSGRNTLCLLVMRGFCMQHRVHWVCIVTGYRDDAALQPDVELMDVTPDGCDGVVQLLGAPDGACAGLVCPAGGAHRLRVHGEDHPGAEARPQVIGGGPRGTAPSQADGKGGIGTLRSEMVYLRGG